MFVGHYGPALAGKSVKNSVPLWVLFLAVRLLDVFWSIFVQLGIEKVRIVPGITVTNPLGSLLHALHPQPGGSESLVPRRLGPTQPRLRR